MRQQKQDELQQLLSLLQLSNLAAEPQLKQEQMADSRRGQDLQTALGLLGLQQSGEAEKAHAALALQQLTQQGQQFGEGQKLSREQLTQTGELAAKDFALRGDANTLGHEKLAQEGEQFNVAQHNDLHKIGMQRDMQEKLAALGLSGELLRNPSYSDKPEMLKSLLAHPDNPALGFQEGQAAQTRQSFLTEAGPNVSKLKAKVEPGHPGSDELANYLSTLPLEHKRMALDQLGVFKSSELSPEQMNAIIATYGAPKHGVRVAPKANTTPSASSYYPANPSYSPFYKQ